MAVTIDAAALATATGSDNATATRLLPVVMALVNRYAPAAPDAVANEAAIRAAAWLIEHPAASVRSESAGDISTSYAPTMTSALRASGAMSLLSGWRIRRAGAA